MLTTRLDQDLQAVISTYKGFLKHQEFMEISLATLDLAKEHGLSKIFVDTVHLKVMLQESQQWINQVWFGKAKQVGIRHMAFLIPEDIFGRMSMEATNKQALQEGAIEIKYFDKVEEARQWLKSA
ncbi:STAS/SEC14 domain-containing protein [Rufibacter roseus]|uniref:STAS/SEC14 domain-containing protein n=1 Tax=Rufibacter roseus TaxID=1567108 RepID=A0ABW2DGI3_9BACT|nr:STAS/SEC14 domain-containing protein [Rufibacter roseus]